MKSNNSQTNFGNYESPELCVIEVQVEKGFAVTGSDNGNENVGENGGGW